MRKLPFGCALALAGIVLAVSPGCSNTDVKKKVIGNDASTADGSVVADSCDAGGIYNYDKDQCESCPAIASDAGPPGMCAPDGPVYHCNLGCSDVDFSKSSIDTTNQQIHLAFTNYPLAITTVQDVFFYVEPPLGDAGELSSTQYPTSIDHNILTMDLSNLDAATFGAFTKILPSGIQLTDACGRSNSADLAFGFTRTNGTWTASCFDGGP